MHKLTILAAALAAGMMTFAASGEAVAKSPRDRESVAVVKKPVAAKAKQKSAKAEAPCPYLFGCKKTEDKKAQAPAPKSDKAKPAGKSAKAKVRKGKARHKSARAQVDNFTTASIGKEKDKTASTNGSKPYSAIIARYASAYGVPVSLARAVIHVESNYRPNITGSAGEVGLMQIKPATARMLGYNGSVKGLYDPETNIKYGMKYLAMAQELGNGTTCGTILKYNAGHAATRMNPVSSAYCRKVKVRLAALGSSA
jgi:soluble lytic murein transglycosylase-like protein